MESCRRDGGYICPQCGVLFFPPDARTWVYSRRVGDKTIKRYCSWSCFREEERLKEQSKPKPKKGAKYKYS